MAFFDERRRNIFVSNRLLFCGLLSYNILRGMPGCSIVGSRGAEQTCCHTQDRPQVCFWPLPFGVLHFCWHLRCITPGYCFAKHGYSTAQNNSVGAAYFDETWCRTRRRLYRLAGYGGGSALFACSYLNKIYEMRAGRGVVCRRMHTECQSRPVTLLYIRGNIASRVALMSIFLVVVSYFNPRRASSTTRRTTSLVVSPSAFASSWSHSNWGLLKVTDCLAMWSTLAPLYGIVK